MSWPKPSKPQSVSRLSRKQQTREQQQFWHKAICQKTETYTTPQKITIVTLCLINAGPVSQTVVPILIKQLVYGFDLSSYISLKAMPMLRQCCSSMLEPFSTCHSKLFPSRHKTLNQYLVTLVNAGPTAGPPSTWLDKL